MIITKDGDIWFGESREEMIAIWWDETFNYVCSPTYLGTYTYYRLIKNSIIKDDYLF